MTSYARILHLNFKQHIFWIFVRIALNKKTKQGFSYILFCPLRILYHSKFILMAISLGTNVIVVTRVHCI